METSERQQRRTTLMLFLGAGASVPAGIPDTRKFVHEFTRHLFTQGEKYETLMKVLEILKRYVESNPNRQVDIELLLETLDRLENRDSDILQYFVENGKYILEGEMEKGPIIEDLREFIRSRVVVQKDQIEYIHPLQEILFRYGRQSGEGPVSIFSFNYDNCIEQFCDLFSLKYCDGFLTEWDPNLFKSPDFDIHLFKLHGSTNWFRTQRGKHIKIPITTKEGSLVLDTGERAVTFIVYPGLKSVYYEPYLDMLGILKERLKRTNVAVVMGYSFRDEDIRKIFWDAATVNGRLIVVLISPSASKIYEESLAMQEDDSHSPLAGRVLVVPSLCERVLPDLSKKYIANLISALSLESSLKSEEILGKRPDYDQLIMQFANCGFIEKVEQYFDLGYFLDRWEDEFRIAVLSLAHLVARDNTTQDEERLEPFKHVIERVLCNGVRVEMTGYEDFHLTFPAFGVWENPLPVDKIRASIKSVFGAIDAIRWRMREDRGMVVLDFFEPLQKVLNLYHDDEWDKGLDLLKYIEIRREKCGEETERIEELVSQIKEDIKEWKDISIKIADTIMSVEVYELAKCFEKWGARIDRLPIIL